MNIQGKFIKKFEVQQVSASFKKREFVVEYAENPLYPQLLKFECTQDRCNIVDDFNPGDVVDVSFNLRGREWVSPDGEAKYFNTLEAWRLQRMADGGSNGAPAMAAQPVYNAASGGADESDDLPF